MRPQMLLLQSGMPLQLAIASWGHMIILCSSIICTFFFYQFVVVLMLSSQQQTVEVAFDSETSAVHHNESSLRFLVR